MKKQKEYKTIEAVEIIDAGAKGKSIAKTEDGRVIFVENAVPGDVVDVQILKKKKSYLQAKVIKFLKYSDKRTEPVCKHFGYCGGCKWQNMKYQHQLYYKQKEVENNLRRLGGVSVQEVEQIVGCNTPYFYRNKLEFSFSNNRWITPEEIERKQEIEDRTGLGFHISGAWDKVMDVEKCHLQEDPSNQIREAVKAYARENNLDFYNAREEAGFLRTLMIRISSVGEIMVVIQFFREEKEKREELLNFLANKFPQITSLQYVINSKANDSIYDQRVITYKGKDCIYEEMENLRFKINAKSFYQTNSKQAYELYKIVRDFASLKGEEIVYDLYTGTGTIAQFVAQKAKKVVGIESVPEAIEDAKENARNNGINNAFFYVGDMKNVFNDDFIEKNATPEVIITDPPRDGMHKDVVAQILKIAPKKIVYVSCNSATQARDLALMQQAYNINKIRAVDMFPQTYHIENVALLTKK